MPRGRYSLHDPHDHSLLGDEHFSCAPGPAGWRYVAQVTDPDGAPAGSVDLTLDDLGRPLRLDLRTRNWQVRGGALNGVTWVRRPTSGGRDTVREENAPAHGFTGRSPAFLVATARLLRPALGAPPARIRLVDLAPPVLAPRTRDEAWALLGSEVHPTDSGPLTVDTYQVDDLETGERHTVHLAGDVVLAAPGTELADLDSPPSAVP